MNYFMMIKINLVLRKRVISLLGLSLIGIFQITCDANDIEHRNPNIIFILADNLGYGDLGCFGSKLLRTPNIDKLASRGILFTNAHCQGTMCNPSRISIMWGKRPSSTGFYSNHFPASKVPEFIKNNVSMSRHFAANGARSSGAPHRRDASRLS